MAWENDQGAHIHQAIGMIAAQCNCDIAEAFGRLTIRSEALGQTLHEMALDVLDRRVRFSRDFSSN